MMVLFWHDIFLVHFTHSKSPPGAPRDLDTYPSSLIPKDGVPPFSDFDWQLAPKAIRAYLLHLHEQLLILHAQLLDLHGQVSQIEVFKRRIEQLEAKLRSDSSNSNKPPSSDTPFKKKQKKKRGKAGAKKGHQGHRQVMLEPTEVLVIKPPQCSCGHSELTETKPFHTHQVIEFPEIRMEVTHFVLQQGRCPKCGTLQKANLPIEHQSGYGPRMTALIGEIAGTHANSRSTIQDFCASVLRIPISKGAIQKVIDRVSEAIKPHYEAIGHVAREAKVNYVDETSWFKNGALMWLWTMVNTQVAFFMIHPRRSKEAFAALIDDWTGILVSDGFKVYQKWVKLRQTCLAHLIRTAKGLAQRKDPEVAAFGRRALAELNRLCSMAHAPPNVGQWRAFYARLSHLISQNHDRKDEAGKFAKRLLREMDSLWVFLEEQGVEPTNNRAERALRFGVMWRKRSQGTESDKGNRWVERILSLRHSCQIRSLHTFPILVDAVDCYFKQQPPNLAWITQNPT
jgi:transposase